MGDDVVLHAVRLTKEYGRGAALVRAVDEVDLDVVRGESVAIMGPSGCGKSTLLHLLGGLERPTRGELTLAGARVDGLGETGLAKLRRHAIGFVFQGFHLVEELTAVENVEMPALLSGTSPREARKRALELLDRTGLGDRAKHLPSELSGGQRQRVAVASRPGRPAAAGARRRADRQPRQRGDRRGVAAVRRLAARTARRWSSSPTTLGSARRRTG